VAHDTESRRPGKHLATATDLSVSAVERHVEATAFQEQVDEDAVAAGDTVPKQARQVRVAEAVVHFQFGSELAVADARDFTTTGEHDAVDEPEPPVADDVFGKEPSTLRWRR
jgi:hypothetical protein